jgi:site-specific DNA-methyltransferase (adenine-specific)
VTEPFYQRDGITVYCSDNRDILASLDSNSISAVVTDPPYGLSKEPDVAEVLTHWLNGDDYTHTGGGFMGKKWDSFVPGPVTWRMVSEAM